MIIALSLFALCFLLASTPVVRVPYGVVCSLYLAQYVTTISDVALMAAAGVTSAYVWMALSTRFGSREPGIMAKQRESQLGAWLGKQRQYRKMTFIAGFVPVFPASVVYPMIGRMRSPVMYAAAGTILAQFLLISLSTWIISSLVHWVSDSQSQEVAILGSTALFALVFTLIGSIDWEYLKKSRALRFKEPTPRTQLFGAQVGGATAENSERLHRWKIGGGDDSDSDDADVIEAEVVRDHGVTESAEESDGDSDDDPEKPSNPVQLS